MFFHREYLIEKQIAKNIAAHRAANNNTNNNSNNSLKRIIDPEDLRLLALKAYEELKISKINSCQLDFNNINRFLLLSSPKEHNDYFLYLKQAITQILVDEKKRRIFQDKWSSVLRSNIMKLFHKVAAEMMCDQAAVPVTHSYAPHYAQPNTNEWKREMMKIYSQIARKVFEEDKLWRIQEKLLEGFVTEGIVNPQEAKRHLAPYRQQLITVARKFMSVNTEIPKTITNMHYLQFGLMRLFELPIPNQQYLHNQLLHAPNPKLLLPLSMKKSFAPLTLEILNKLNKVDMVSLKYWSLFDDQPTDVYEKVRKAQGWEPKIDVLLRGLRKKIKAGLFKYINLVNDLVLRHANKDLNEEAVNQLVSYVEMALEICNKHSEIQAEEIALQKMDIGMVFHFNNFVKNPKQKQFLLKLIELYLKLIEACKKPRIKMRSIKDISINIYKVLKYNREEKLAKEISFLVEPFYGNLLPQEKEDFFIEIVREVNIEWTREQSNCAEIVKIDANVLSFLASLIQKHDLLYLSKNKLTILEFMLILALNYDQKSYFEPKRSLCYLNVELSCSPAGSSIFAFLQQSNNATFKRFRQNLRTKYGDYRFADYQMEGLLAIIDQIVASRIVGLSERIASSDNNTNSVCSKSSYFSVLVQFLQETERINPQMHELTNRYFNSCVKPYMLVFRKIKTRDQHKSNVRLLIKHDVSFLIQSSASANPRVAAFSQNCLNSFIEQLPDLGFHMKILIVFIETISHLYSKVSQEYDSKSDTLRGKHLQYDILIPTDIKEISKRLVSLMCTLYTVVLRGHCISDTYLKMRISYLVRQENTNTTKLNFGCKFLKYLINNFREDRDFIQNEVMMGNSCLWWINEEEFSKKIKSQAPESFVLDKTLIPLHKGVCNSQELQRIFNSVKPQIETEFLIIPDRSTQNQIPDILKESEMIAAELRNMQLIDASKQSIDQAINRLFKVVGRVKLIYLTPRRRTHLLSGLLEVCKKWLNRSLLKYILFKIVPFFYCIGSYNSGVLILIAEMLHFLTLELNELTKFNPARNISQEDIFHLKLDYFQGVQNYEIDENSQKYTNTYESICKSRGRPSQGVSPSTRYIVYKLHQQRLNNVKNMQKVVLKYLSVHMQVNLAKGIKLAVINTLLFENLRLKKYVLEWLPLETICYALKSQLEYVNVLKASQEKDEINYEGISIDYFYFKTLKMGLYHFQKLHTYYDEQLLARSTNVEKLTSKISTFIQVCNYLHREQLHKIPTKKKVSRYQTFQKKNNKGYSMIVSSLKRTQSPYYAHQSRRIQKTDNSTEQEVTLELPIFRFMLLYLISERIDQARAYSYTELSKIQNPYSIAGKKKFIKNSQIIQLMDHLGNKSLVLIYNIVKNFQHCLEDPTAIFRELGRRLGYVKIYNFAEFLEVYIESNKEDELNLRQINYWKVPHIQMLLKYLTKQYDNIPYLQLYVTKILTRLHSEQLLFYLPQIHQTLTLRSSGVIARFLLEYANKSTLFAHQLIWISKVEAKQEIDPHNKTKRTPQVESHLATLRSSSIQVIDRTIRNMDSEKKYFFELVDDFFEQVTSISGKLLPKMPGDVKRNIIQEELEKIKVTPEIYMPTNPRFQVCSIKTESGTPMQSAAKCPIFVTFYCHKYGGPDEYFQNKMKEKRRKKFEELDFAIDGTDEMMPAKLPDVNKFSKIWRSDFETVSKELIQLDDIKVDIKLDQRKASSPSGPAVSQSLYLPYRKVNTQVGTINNNSSGSGTHVRSQVLGGRMINSSMKQETEVSCIFKVFDDIRQDCLALQVIRLFLEIFDKNELGLFLYPYKTISNRTGKQLDIGGIIECVPNTVSRDGIGKTNKQSLYDYFISRFGAEHNINFQQARDNFIKSQAAYSVVSYMLQIKDRHNGNILINNEGYLIHIDFGFIFDISPAGNMKFESANFKLTEEMIRIMGGSVTSEPFNLYLNLVIKAFLVVRKYHKHIFYTVKQMVKSGLPCFMPKTLENLNSRFMLHLNDFQAAEYMRGVVMDAADKWTTNWYDRIQWIQQKIYH